MKLTTSEIRWIITIIYEIFNFIVNIKKEKKDGKNKVSASGKK